VLNWVEFHTQFSQATTVVYPHEYPITVSMVDICQLLPLNAPCLPIPVLMSQFILYFFVLHRR